MALHNYAFKPTAVEMLRLNQSSRSGGLMRRWASMAKSSGAFQKI